MVKRYRFAVLLMLFWWGGTPSIELGAESCACQNKPDRCQGTCIAGWSD